MSKYRNFVLPVSMAYKIDVTKPELHKLFVRQAKKGQRLKILSLLLPTALILTAATISPWPKKT